MSMVKMVVFPEPAGADTPMHLRLSLVRACRTASIASAWKSRSSKLALMVIFGARGAANTASSWSWSLELDDALGSGELIACPLRSQYCLGSMMIELVTDFMRERK